MPAPTRRMNPARERRTWLALVASAGASLVVGMRAREKSISGARLAHEAPGFDGRAPGRRDPGPLRLRDLREVGGPALEERRERLPGFGRGEALREGERLLGNAGAKGAGIASEEGARRSKGLRRAGREVAGAGSREREELRARREDGVDEAELSSPLGVDPGSEEQNLGSDRVAHPPRQEQAGAGLGDEAEAHERHPEPRSARGVDQIAVQEHRRPDADG